ncbi:MAG: hypothetical protein H6819_06170 [Phycisphaerales bacterium]|nr:hypothetical protein [Phycisphaerales bacterium]MCB9858594.1 hypothetical protein [Phycisphaerales bacterium]
MTSIPVSPRDAFVEWCETHQAGFVETYGEIGMSKSQATAFAETTDKARTLLIEQEEARQRYAVATREAEQIVGLLRRQAGDAVRSIRAFAELQPAPAKVYATARVAPPATPTPTPPPGRPMRLAATLDATDGSLTLTWKARMPRRRAGATYLVRRQLPGEEGFSILGTTGKKMFVDESLPAGMTTVRYTVQAQRGESMGSLSAVLVVNVGKRQNAEMSKSQNADGLMAGSGVRGEIRRAASDVSNPYAGVPG